jgi:choline dehydrogenase
MTQQKSEDKMSSYSESDPVAAEFTERVRGNQRKLTSDLKPHYDFIVFGSGSSSERAGEILLAAHKI